FAAFGFAAGLMHSLGMRIVGEGVDKERAFGIRLFTELVLIATLLFFLPAALAARGLMGGAQMLAMAALVMGLSAFLLPRGPAAADASQQADAGASAGRAGWIALGIFVLFACGQVALWVFLERIAHDIGADATQMGLLFSALKVVGGLSAALVAALGDKLGNRLPHLLVFFALCIGVALLAARPSFMVFAFGAWIWEAAFTIGCVFQTAAIAKLDPGNKLVVLVPAAFAISAFVGPALGGLLAATGFAPLLALAVACAAIPAVAYWLFAGRMAAKGG
ncbi:MAG: MFS transporter, partial [Gammaproteobacteria bacterium]|nr:MFS transporter [Gammaproteobacteria bacterium]